jgi:hypothetical protein
MSMSLNFFLKKSAPPFCVNCQFFIQHKNNYPYDPVPNDHLYGKCRKFYEMDLITGNVIHDYAIVCRNNKEKCGLSGREYKPY